MTDEETLELELELDDSDLDLLIQACNDSVLVLRVGQGRSSVDIRPRVERIEGLRDLLQKIRSQT
jgi:hypothetical protein